MNPHDRFVGWSVCWCVVGKSLLLSTPLIIIRYGVIHLLESSVNEMAMWYIIFKVRTSVDVNNGHAPRLTFVF